LRQKVFHSNTSKWQRFGAHLRNIIVSVCRQRVRGIFDTHRFQQAVIRQNESAGGVAAHIRPRHSG
jgi:hypothetical protein